MSEEEHERLFSADEANECLPVIAPALQTLQRVHQVMEELNDEVMSSIPTNGGGEVHRRFMRAVDEAAAALDVVQGLGIVVRDPASGLVDFASEHDGEIVYLCWRLGEEAVAWWHPRDTGFAGRLPL